MKAGAYLQQTSYSAINESTATGRFRDARQNLEQCAFAGPISANDPEHLSVFDLERDVLQGPNHILWSIPMLFLISVFCFLLSAFQFAKPAQLAQIPVVLKRRADERSHGGGERF